VQARRQHLARHASLKQPLADDGHHVAVFRGALNADPELAVAVAAIKALTSVIALSKSETIMGLQLEVSSAARRWLAEHWTSVFDSHAALSRSLRAPYVLGSSRAQPTLCAATPPHPYPCLRAASCSCGARATLLKDGSAWRSCWTTTAEALFRYVSRTASLDSSDLAKSKAWLIERVRTLFLSGRPSLTFRPL